MRIYFGTKKLKKICENYKKASIKWGPENAKKLFQRLAQIEAAEILADLKKIPDARCHELKGNRKGQFAVDLKHPKRLIFLPCDVSGEEFTDIQSDEMVKAVIIKEVTDYHG